MITKVLNKAGTELFDTGPVELLSIESESVKFVPADVKKNFPKLRKFEIIHSGLIHLEREDMRQFGSDIISVSFWKNSLTALEGDIFDFNTNLEYIGLDQNPLKFINPALFQSFKRRSLKLVEIKNSTCIDQVSRKLSSVQWKYSKCNDDCEKNLNLKRISDREDFFHEIYPEISTEQKLKIQQITDYIEDFKNLKTKFDDIQDNSRDITDIKLKHEQNEKITVFVVISFFGLTILYICVLHCKMSKCEEQFKNSQRVDRAVINGNDISLAIQNESYMMNGNNHKHFMMKSNKATEIVEEFDDLNYYEDPELIKATKTMGSKS